MSGSKFICDVCSKTCKSDDDLYNHKTYSRLCKKHFHICKSCDSKHRTKERLLKHNQRSHNQAYNYSCKRCKRRFKFIAQLNRHACPLKDAKFNCNFCNHGTSSVNALRDHMRRQHGVDNNQIESLDDHDDQFESGLSIHTVKDTNQVVVNNDCISLLETTECKFICEVCSKTYKSDDELYYHKKDSRLLCQKHFHICEGCDSKHRTKERLLKHNQRSHNQAYNYSCERCKRRYRVIALLNSHACPLEEKNLNCNFCDYKTNSCDTLRRHIRCKHEVNENQIESLDDHVDQFESDSSKHTVKDTNQVVVNNDCISLLETTECKFICEVCSKTCKSDYHLYFHKRNSNRCKDHFHICKSCDRKHRTKERLLKHNQRSHNQAYKYVCGKCDCRFRIIRDLNRHSCPLKEEKINCNYCAHRANSRRSLNNHIKNKHARDKPVSECKKCNKQFANAKELKQHWKIAHRRARSYNSKFKTINRSAIEILDIQKYCEEIDKLKEDQCYYLDEGEFNIYDTPISICAIIGIKGLFDFKATIGYFNSKLMIEEVLEKFKELPNESRLILDNAPWHKTVEFKAALANYTSKFRGQAIYLPPNCTYELNPIERFFVDIRKLYTIAEANQKKVTIQVNSMTSEEKREKFVNFIMNNVKNIKPVEEYYKIIQETRNEWLKYNKIIVAM